jgi:hypothetical protein
VIQHGVHSVPNRKLGYTTDDNARALITAAYHYNLTKSPEDLRLATIYLSFLHYAQSPTYLFRNVMSYQRVFMDEDGTEDCLGRCLWALGFTASSSLPNNIRIVAKKLFESSIAWIGDIQSPRAKAYAMMGICEFLRLNNDGKLGLASKISILADSMIRGRKTYGSDDFPWYEGYMTYGNAVLPLGMLAAAEVTGKKAYRRNAAEAIQFLTDIEIVGDRLELVGNDGWYHRGGRRAWWDQQTIDAGYTVYLYTRAGEVLGEYEFHELAHIAHEWFIGRNRSGTGS